MACFITPAIIGLIVHIIGRISKETRDKLKLNLLGTMLLGGAILLMLEHVWHGEVVPYPPFLTEAKNPGGWLTIIHEAATVGSAMTIGVTALWGGIVAHSRISQIFGKIRELSIATRMSKTASN